MRRCMWDCSQHWHSFFFFLILFCLSGNKKKFVLLETMYTCRPPKVVWVYSTRLGFASQCDVDISKGITNLYIPCFLWNLLCKRTSCTLIRISRAFASHWDDTFPVAFVDIQGIRLWCWLDLVSLGPLVWKDSS